MTALVHKTGLKKKKYIYTHTHTHTHTYTHTLTMNFFSTDSSTCQAVSLHWKYFHKTISSNCCIVVL